MTLLHFYHCCTELAFTILLQLFSKNYIANFKLTYFFDYCRKKKLTALATITTNVILENDKAGTDASASMSYSKIKQKNQPPQKETNSHENVFDWWNKIKSQFSLFIRQKMACIKGTPLTFWRTGRCKHAGNIIHILWLVLPFPLMVMLTCQKPLPKKRQGRRRLHANANGCKQGLNM